MAEFCKECVGELGMLKFDVPPLFCEHCGINFPYLKISMWGKFKKWLFNFFHTELENRKKQLQ